MKFRSRNLFDCNNPPSCTCRHSNGSVLLTAQCNHVLPLLSLSKPSSSSMSWLGTCNITKYTYHNTYQMSHITKSMETKSRLQVWFMSLSILALIYLVILDSPTNLTKKLKVFDMVHAAGPHAGGHALFVPHIHIYTLLDQQL